MAVLGLDLGVDDPQVGFEDVAADGEKLMQLKIFSLVLIVLVCICSVFISVCSVLVSSMFLGVSWHGHPKQKDECVVKKTIKKLT